MERNEIIDFIKQLMVETKTGMITYGEVMDKVIEYLQNSRYLNKNELIEMVKNMDYENDTFVEFLEKELSWRHSLLNKTEYLDMLLSIPSPEHFVDTVKNNFKELEKKALQSKNK